MSTSILDYRSWIETYKTGKIEIIQNLTKHICNLPSNLSLENRIDDVSPCGIALRANNSILVESIFHGIRPVK